MSGQPFVHPGPAKLMAEAQEFLIEEGIITRTTLDTIVRLTKERDAALAKIEQLKDLVCDREDTIIERDATIGCVQALLGDTSGPLWSVRGVREADLRAALEDRAS